MAGTLISNHTPSTGVWAGAAGTSGAAPTGTTKFAAGATTADVSAAGKPRDGCGNASARALDELMKYGANVMKSNATPATSAPEPRASSAAGRKPAAIKTRGASRED